MKVILILYAVFVTTTSLLAQDLVEKEGVYTNLFSKKSPPPNFETWLVDQADLLEQDQQISQAIKSWEEKYQTGLEMAVVTVNSLEYQDECSYAANLFKQYGIGKTQKDYGVLILVAPNEGRWCIKVGSALEKYITEIEVNAIDQVSFWQSEVKKGIYDPSILRVIDAIHNEVDTNNYAQRIKNEIYSQQQQLIAEIEQHKFEEQAKAERLQRIRSNAGFLWITIKIGIALLLIYLTIFYIQNLYLERRIALKENHQVVEELLAILREANIEYGNLIEYPIVADALAKHSQILDMTKFTPTWPSKMRKHTGQLKSLKNEVLDDCSQIKNSLQVNAINTGVDL